MRVTRARDGRGGRLLALAALLVAVAGCASPVGYRTIGPRDAYRDLTASALTGDEPSVFSRQLLARLGLGERFEQEPEVVLAELDAGLGWVDDRQRLFVLAELSLAHAEHGGGRPYFLAAAIYAWAFLLPADPAAASERFDPRLPLALDLYQRGLAAGLARDAGHEIDLTPRTVALPFGRLVLTVAPDELRYGGYELRRFVATRAIRVRGLRNTYRRAGLGVQLAAKLRRRAEEANPWLSPLATVPVTAVLHIDDVHGGLAEGHVRGRIELHEADVTPELCLAGQVVPLESDPSSVLAYGLEDAPLWDFEIAGFRRADLNLFGTGEDIGLFMMRPYRPGRIPVVFVHGTASSPARWAEMGNELLADARLAPRYQLWFFIYNTGNPVVYSAMRLRRFLTRVVEDVDPEGRDPALRQMVVIGHSQGGLITKMMAVDVGDHLWNAFTRVPIEELDLPEESRTLLHEMAFFAPVPSVGRVVFIATPHRGSFLAGNWLGNIARRLVRLPANLAKTSAQLLQVLPRSPTAGTRGFTSIDSMNPRNPALQAIASLPLADGVPGHSIVAVEGDGPFEDGSDGVVEYRSAHVEGVASELVVRSAHSCQGRPETIEEVRRILRVHLESLEGVLPPVTARPGDPCAAAAVLP